MRYLKIIALLFLTINLFSQSDEQIPLYRVEYAPDSSGNWIVRGRTGDGEPIWSKKDSLGFMDSLYINGIWYFTGDTVSISTDSIYDSALGGTNDRLLQLRDGTGSVEFDPSSVNEIQHIDGYITTAGGNILSPHLLKRINLTALPKAGFFIPPDYHFVVDESPYNELGESFMIGDTILYKRCQECDTVLVGIVDTSNINELGELWRTEDTLFYKPCPDCGIFSTSVDTSNINERGVPRISNDSLFYKECYVCTEYFYGKIIHPTHYADPDSIIGNEYITSFIQVADSIKIIDGGGTYAILDRNLYTYSDSIHGISGTNRIVDMRANKFLTFQGQTATDTSFTTFSKYGFASQHKEAGWGKFGYENYNIEGFGATMYSDSVIHFTNNSGGGIFVRPLSHPAERGFLLEAGGSGHALMSWKNSQIFADNSGLLFAPLGTVGTLGQVLISDASGYAHWSTPPPGGPDSTSVSNTATVSLSEVANVITANVNDGSITPAKLDRVYLDSAAFKVQNLETDLVNKVTKGYRTGDLAIGPNSKFENTGSTLTIKGENDTKALEIKPDSLSDGLTYISLNAKTLQEYDYPNFDVIGREFDVNENMDAPNMVFRMGYNPSTLPPEGQVGLEDAWEYSYNLNQAGPVADTVVERHIEFWPRYGRPAQRLMSYAASWNGLKTEYAFVSSLTKNKAENGDDLVVTDHRTNSFSTERWYNGLQLISENALYPITVENKLRILGAGQLFNDDGNALYFGLNTNRNDFTFYGNNNNFFRLKNDQNTTGFGFGFNGLGWFGLTELATGATPITLKQGASHALLTLASDRIGVNQQSPSYNLDVTGSGRLTDWTGTATILTGRNAAGKMVDLSLGLNLSIVSGQLKYTEDTTNEIQYLDTFSITSNTLSASIFKDGRPASTVNLAPYLDNTDSQNLSNGGKTGNNQTINISGGTGVTFSVADGDSSSTNEKFGNFLPSTRIAFGSPTDTITSSTSLTWATNTFSVIGIADILRTGNNTFISGGNQTQTGTENIALGFNSLRDITTANANIAIGYEASNKNTTASNQIGIGYQALKDNLVGTGNIAIGDRALTKNLANSNQAIGNQALQNNTTGANNVAVGNIALNVNVSGSNNTAIGGFANYGTQGSNNIAIGLQTLFSTGAKTNTTAIGTFAGFSNVNGDGNVFLGYGAAYNELGSNKLYIENSISSTPLIGGDFSANRLGINRDITSLGATLHVGGNLKVDNLTVTPTKIGAWGSANEATRLKLGNGLSITDSTLHVATNLDNDPLNEIQTISTSGAAGNITLSSSGGTLNLNVNDADSNPANEYNTSMSLSGTTVQVTDGGGTLGVDISSIIPSTFWNLSSTKLTPLSTSYDVAIGTTATLYNKFTVNGNIGAYPTSPAQIYLGDVNFDNASFYNKAPGIGAKLDAATGVGGTLSMYTYNGSRTERITILGDAGDVGINQTSPTAKLHVNGNFKVATLSATPSKFAMWSSANEATSATFGSGFSISGGALIFTETYLGTLTSLATNNGITGGTITGSGTIGLTGNALGVHNLASNGFMVRTSAGNVSARSLVQGTGITISNTDGVAGNPTITNSAPDQTVSISGAGITSVTGTYPNFTVTSTEVDGSTSNELNVLSLGAKSGITVPLNSSNSGGTINFKEGSGITLTRSTNDLTIASTATSDGNGIYDGSGSLSGNTTVSQGLNRYYHSTSTSGGVGTDFDIRYDYGYLGTYNGTSISAFKSISGESTITTSLAGITKSFLKSNPISSLIGYDSTYLITGNAVAKLKINNSFGTSGDVLYSGGSGSMYWGAPSGGITGSGTATRLAFWDGTTSLSSNSNAYWDNTNSRLGLGKSTVYNRLDINGDLGFYKTSSPPQIYLGDNNFDNGSYYNSAPGIGAAGSSAPYADLAFFRYGGVANSRTEIMRIDADGLGIFTTNPAYGLDVNSSVRVVERSGTAANRAMFDSNGKLVQSTGIAESHGITSNYIAKSASGYAWSNSQLYDNGTSVGIATASPNASAKLHVNGNALITGTLQVQTNGGTSIAMAGLTSDLKLASLGYSGNLNLSGGVLESKSTDIQTFTSSGTWTKPSGAKTVHIIMHGGGGGGGSGGYVSSTPASGGAGGGGGARTETDFVASLLSGTVSITVGGGGSAGSGVNGGGSDSDGNYGSDGGFSSFGTLARAYGGDGGGPGITLSASVGGAGGPGSFDGGTGGAGGAPGANQGSQAPASKFASMGGNGGAGCSLTTTGSNQNALFAPFGGTPNSANYFGYGGTGGGSGSAAGGAGNTYGAGGGGGAAKTGTTSGSGGAGAAGIVIVITSF